MRRDPHSVLLLGLALAMSAAACTNIRLDPRPSYRPDENFIAGDRVPVSRLHVFLPNIGVARPSDDVVNGNNLSFIVTVRNEGNVRSREFDIKVDVWVGTVPPAPASFTRTIRTSGNLAPGAETSANIGPVTLPPIAQRPVDVLVQVTADPPTATSAGGEIWESDETNNIRERTFTIY